MIIDSHYHLEERMQPLTQLLEQMDQHDIQRLALIATMNDPLPWNGATNGASVILRTLLDSPLRSTGLRLYTGTVTADGSFDVLGKRYCIYDTPDNAMVAHVMQAHPDRFYGWIFINPRVSDPLAEIEKWMTQPGWMVRTATPITARWCRTFLACRLRTQRKSAFLAATFKRRSPTTPRARLGGMMN